MRCVLAYPLYGVAVVIGLVGLVVLVVGSLLANFAGWVLQ